MSRQLPPRHPTTVGHPVDVASGVVFTAWHDFELRGPRPLTWRRFYSSASVEPTPLGRGWAGLFFMRIEQEQNRVLLHNDEGRVVELEVPPENRTTNDLANQLELRAEAGNFHVYDWHNYLRYFFAPQSPGRWRLEWVEDLAGGRTRVLYDAAGRFRGVEQPGVRTITAELNAQGLVGSLTLASPGGQPRLLVRYEYDSQQRLVAASDPAGRPLRYAYDDRHRLTRETGRGGGSFRFEYDDDGYCTHTWGDGGYMERHLTYNKEKRTTKVRDSLGHLTRYQMDARGLVVQKISPRGGRTETEYDEHGRVLSVTYPHGGTIKYEYDERGDRVSFTDEMEAVARVKFNQQHLPVEAVDPAEAKWRLKYNSRGSLVASTTPENVTWTLERDERGLLKTFVKPNGGRVEHAYAPDLLWQEVRDQLSLIERLEYDARGNEVAKSDAEGLVYRVDHDAAGRHVAIRYAEGTVIEFAWDADGNLVERTGPAGARDRWEYDQFRRLTAHVDNAGQRMRLEYDTEGRLAAVVNHVGERLELRRDADGNVTEQTFFDGRVERYEYDLAGLPVRLHCSDGRTVEQQHDLCGRVVERTDSDGRRTALVYDARGCILVAETNDAVVEFQYDALNRIVAEVQNGVRVERRYDAEHNPTGRALPGAGVEELKVDFDLRGRPVRVTQGDQFVGGVEWDALDRLRGRTLPGGAAERRQFGPDRRLAQQEVVGAQGEAVVRRRYTYDAAGNVARLEDSRRGATRFQYDLLNRLVRAERAHGPAEWYEYDPVGNVLASHLGRRQVAPGGLTLADGAARYSYDAGGRVEDVSQTGGTLSLSYDAQGQLLGVTRAGAEPVRFGYDALGRRAWKEVGGRRTSFIWEGFELAAELSDGKATRQYYSFNMTPLAQWSGGRWLAPVTNHLSVPQELVDDRGSVAWEATLDAYGGVLQERGEGVESPVRFRGQYHDRETGFYYNIHRHYSPALAGYVSPDPVGIMGGVNFYAFSRNPVMWDDPFGLFCAPGHVVNQPTGVPFVGPGTNKAKGDYGENLTHNYFTTNGYTRVDVPGRHQGIDGIYQHNVNGDYVIAESKYGTSRLGKTKDGQQMSMTWINGTSSPSTGGQTRIDHALQPGHNAVNLVGNTTTVVSHSDSVGNLTIKHHGTY